MKALGAPGAQDAPGTPAALEAAEAPNASNAPNAPNAPDVPDARRVPSGTRLADALLVLLTFAAGVTDAVSFFGLGGVFTANMTGNLVLVGFSGAHAAHGDVLRCATALAGFVLGLLGASRLLPGGTEPGGTGTGTEALWPRRVTAVLAGELALHIAFLAGWAATGARPGGAAAAGLILVSAAAMGAQTAAACRLARAGITTTFLTGTLTALASGLAAGRRTHAGLRGCVLGALLGGGLAGGALLTRSPVTAGVLAPAATAAVIVLAMWRLHSPATERGRARRGARSKAR